VSLLNSTNIYSKNKIGFYFSGVQFLQEKHLVQRYIWQQNNKRKKTFWDDYHYDLTGKIVLNDALIKAAIDSFWKKIVSEIKDEHIIALFRIQTQDNIIYTLGNLISLSKEDKKYYYDYIVNRLYIKNDEYRQVKLTSIIFSYGIRNGLIEKKNLISEHIDNDLIIQNQFYKKYKLPITMDPFKYGKLIQKETTDSKDSYFVKVTPLTYAKIILKDKFTNEVIFYKNGDPILEYIDTLIYKDSTSYLLRTISNNKYYYQLNGKLELVTVNKLSRYIKPLIQSEKPKLNENFITLDIETRVIDGKHIPYLISWFKDTGKNNGSFYLSHYNNPDEMIKACILELCKLKFNYHKVYIHNLANFDGIFLLRNLTDIATDIKVIINSGKLITIDFCFKKEHWKDSMVLSFRDSYQILPASLRKLAKSFDVTTQKTIFPYNFVNNPNLDLFYKGTVPAYEFFNNVTNDEYIQYCEQFKNKIWSLYDESCKYCIEDCKALHEVITKFNSFYFNVFKQNINNAPTISSHAFKLYRTQFMLNDIIPMIYGDEYNFIKNSYTGGSTDMFIPSNQNGELIYGYDVNSLYPYIMKNHLMPIGEKTYFEGDIRKINPDAYGFFYCEVECPKDINHPIIQLHVKTKGGLRTMAPTGTFKTVIFSPEMDNAIKLGYKFKILKGYIYNQNNIFSNYVDNLYKIRTDYSKDHPMNYIAKLFLNSLYGRFGMKDIFDKNLIVNSEKFGILTENIDSKPYFINEIIKLNNNYLIQIEDKIKRYNNLEYNVNVAISSAITAYARIFMSKFKNNSNLKVFYTDTDSIFTNLNPNEMNKIFPGIINNKELGKLKLESVSKKGIFLAPKCYALQTVDDKFIFKVKGLINTTHLNINDFNKLVFQDSIIKKNQTKWYKSLSQGTIALLEQSYTLKVTDNKRELIYNSDKKLIATKPYILYNNKLH